MRLAKLHIHLSLYTLYGSLTSHTITRGGTYIICHTYIHPMYTDIPELMITQPTHTYNNPTNNTHTHTLVGRSYF